MKFIPGKKIRHKQVIADSRWHPDAEVFAVANFESTVELYKGDEKVQEFFDHHGTTPIRKVRFDADNKLITAATIVNVFDIETRQKTKLRRSKEKDKISSLTIFNPYHIVAGTDGGDLIIWDSRCSQKPTHWFKGGDYGDITDSIGTLRSKLYYTTGDGYINAYDMRQRKIVEQSPEQWDTGFQSMKMTEDKKNIIVGTESGSLFVYKTSDLITPWNRIGLAEEVGNSGDSAINVIESTINDGIYIAGCSDGRLRSFYLVGKQYRGLIEKRIDRADIESVHMNPLDQSEFICSGPWFVQPVNYENDGDSDIGDSNDEESSQEHSDCENHRINRDSAPDHADDYLNLF